MTAPDEATAGDRLEETLGRVLRAGVMVSTLCLGSGLAIALSGALVGAVPVLAQLLLTIGLIVLLATPASRVVVSAIAYARSRDWLFVALTVIVLLELAASVAVAIQRATL